MPLALLMRIPLVAVLALALSSAALAQSRGIPQNGFPTWQERMLQVLFNRSRAEPNADPKACATTTARGPLAYSYNFNRAARFHSANMSKVGCFQHNSPCLLVSDISNRFAPMGTCDGSASCACNNTPVCSASCTAAECTQTFARVAMFGSPAGAEVIHAGVSTPRAAHSGWMNSPEHCAIILGDFGTVGTGTLGTYWSGNFAGTGSAPGTLAAGGHEVGTSFGQFTNTSAQSVAFRVNYAHPAGGPQSTQLNLDGACSPMTLERGSPGNSTWLASVSFSGAGCRRYLFSFKDASGATVVLPETGSYGVGGSLATCPDWGPTPPAQCSSVQHRPAPPTGLQVR